MVGTQINASQHVQIVGTKARIEMQTPFVPPRMSVDDSTRLDDPVPREIGLLEVDPYELEDTNFARAARAEAELEFGVEIRQVRVVDVVFRSERSGTWERL